MYRFLFIWFGQVAAGIGSNLATFCLGIWLYRQSESVSQFSALLFSFTVPIVLLAGVAGRAAERWNQQRTMLVADAVGGVVALGYLLLFQAQLAQPWTVYVLAFLGGCVSAFQWPAYRSWSTRLVRPEDFGRVGGIMKLGEGIPHLLGPALGGALMTSASLTAVFTINLVTSALSVVVLVLAGGHDATPTVRDPAKPQAKRDTELSAFLGSRPGLMGLLVITPFIAFTEGWVITLFQPYMLHHVEAHEMGLMLSLGGSGMVAGGIAMGVWGGPRRQVFSVFGAIFAQSIVVGILVMLTPGFYTGTVAAFFYFFSIPFLSGSNQAIWQAQTPLPLQGRMFAFRRAVESVATPASMVSAGVLVDYVLTPLLDDGGVLAGLGGLLAKGPTQAIAVLLLGVAGSNVLVVVGALAYRPLRRVDLEGPQLTLKGEDPGDVSLVEGMRAEGRGI